MPSTEEFDAFREVMRNLSDVLSGIEPERHNIIQELVLSKGRPFPDKLHHYTNIRGIAGIVQSNHIWATDFRSLNDARELMHGTDLLIQELERFAEEFGGSIALLLNKLSCFYQEHGDAYRNFFETYIISFSEDPDLLSQWRAYSDQARGCCIEFDLTDSRLFTIVDETTLWALEILPVLYDESIQRRLIRSGIERLLRYLNSTEWTVERSVSSSEMEQGILLGLLMHAFEPFITAFKHPGFSEEMEWRAIVSCPTNLTLGVKKEIDTDLGPRPYLECVFIQGDDERLWQRELLPITGVKHGPLADGRSKEEIRNLLMAMGYSDNVVYSNSRIPLR